MHQADQGRHLHQGTDHPGKRLTRIDAEHADGHRDGQFEVIAGGGKGNGRIF